MPHTVMRQCGAVRSTAVADGQRRHGTQPGSVPTKPGAGQFNDQYRHEAGNPEFAR